MEIEDIARRLSELEQQVIDMERDKQKFRAALATEIRQWRETLERVFHYDTREKIKVRRDA